MPFMDIFERAAMEKGLLLGIETSLKVRFGAEGLELMPELREIRDHVLLSKVLNRIETAGSPADVRRVWTRKRLPESGGAGELGRRKAHVFGHGRDDRLRRGRDLAGS